MEKTKKIKIFLGLFYAISVGLFLYLIFSKFSISEITTYSFIKNNRDYFFELRNSNLFFFRINIYLIYNYLDIGFGILITTRFIRWVYIWKNLRSYFFNFWYCNRSNSFIFIRQLFCQGHDKR